ncbi:hypothetical protein ACJMK2_006725 [Sinanodonta woodiana]|uniref:Protein glass n=1 Tax=Sinanodonta woodiana TaxID=1069815 RepID=A0ABD3VUH2_SINWO
MHLGHMPSGNIGCPSPPPPPPLTYAVNHSSQMHPMTYQAGGPSQYPSLHTQIHGDPIQHSGHPQQQGMFPSMSVNVSMSMNVVPPNFVNNQYNYNPAQQWGSSQPQHHYTDYHHHSPPPGHLASFQTHYSPYPAQSHHYPQSYSLSSDYRSAMVDARNIICKRSDKKETSTYNVSHYKRSKFIEDKMHSDAHCLENGKINLCRICGKTYARPSTLKTHLRTHSGEKPYKCSTCHKSFSQAANLTAHVRTHSGEKPFRCPICDRKFSQSSSVTTHMRTHSGERPYRCHLCKKAFSDSSTLTKHLRIHSGEKPYQCKLCLLRFSQSGNLNRHMRVHANNT